MNHFDYDEVPIMFEACSQRSDEPEDSSFRRNISRTPSASISISMAYLDQSETQSKLARKTPIDQMSGPLYATGNPFQNSLVKAGNRKDGYRWDNDYGRKNEHLLMSGPLGMCNDPYCTTCPTYIKVSQQRKPIASIIFDPKFHNSLYGDFKGFGRKLLSLCSPCIPGVMNPHTKVVQEWNKFLAIFCLVAIFVDPLFFFSIYVDVNKNNISIVIDWKMAKILVLLRSVTDVVYFLNILLQFRLAYVSPESTVVGAGDLVDQPKEIALNYLKRYFFFDLFVVLPLPQIIIYFVLPSSLVSSEANYAKNLLRLAILIQYIPRLFRFLPLLIGQSPTGFIFESVWASFILNLLIFMLSGHVVGACWYLFGLQRVNECLQDKGTSDCLDSSSGAFSYGIYANAIPLYIETSVVNKYVYALFWGFQQISTLAGNQVPSYFEWEVLFTMSIIGLGLLLFALLIGNIQNFLQGLGRRRLEMQLRGRDVEKWMSHRRLSEELKRRVREAERYSWAATRGVPEKMVLENLPEDLLIDIRRHLFNFVTKVRIFSHLDEDEPILEAIRERLIQTTYLKESRILSRGGLVQKMVFIVRGKLESIGEDGIPVPLSEGDACGEELLRWYLEQSSESKDGKNKLQGEGLTSDRTVKCLTNVEAFSLRAKDIEEVTTLFASFLRSPRVQGVIRYESPYWRSLAANRIQVAWRYMKKRLRNAHRDKMIIKY
ncbi:probable cyclic nucleotide-gated ion channel 20, chloroplastic isoform X1 [Vicia villosa]|uniref:probable cyclic nucleotide-gated ion channel 20, chloroplastic isoform X1 n=2 Tax=Vicia villosa TaxID=3911 RepID=UPI00273BB885|nr:probable cyclic nucleotide-gated ion channel 20, chloroplastic isoform X1 [Vicia villosa]